jgi:integrase
VVPYREPETGKQRWPSFRTYEEARRFKRGQAADADRGEFVEASRQTLHEYLREWVERYQGGRRGFREETRGGYRQLLDSYALRYFDPRLKLSELGPRHVAKFIAWLCDEQAQGRRLAEEQRARLAEKRGMPVSQVRIVAEPTPPAKRAWLEVVEAPARLSDKTVRNIIVPVRAALATAKREGLVRHNPVDGAQLPHRPQVEEDDDQEDVRALGRDQLAAFLLVVHPRYRLLFRLLASTGLRISEAIGLQWRHLELDGDRPHVKVRRRIVRGNVGPVKSAGSRSNRSRRDVPLSTSLVDELRAWRKQTEWPGADDLVFTSSAGTALGPDNARATCARPLRRRVRRGRGSTRSVTPARRC